MRITITAGMYEKAKAIIESTGQRLYFDDSRKSHILDITELINTKKIEEFKKAIVRCRGAKAANFEIDQWLELRSTGFDGVGAVKPKKLYRFFDCVKLMLGKTKRGRMYQKTRFGEWWPFFIESGTYTKAHRDRDSYVPACATFSGSYIYLGESRGANFSWGEANIVGTVADILSGKGLFIETDELNEMQDALEARLFSVADKIGTVFDVWGRAKECGDRDRWNKQILNLGDTDNTTRAVIDLVNEEEPEQDLGPGSLVVVNGQHWASDDDDDDVEFTDDEVDAPKVYLPIHPYVTIYSLAKHDRYTIHVDQIREHVFDPSVRENLILPEKTNAVIDMLVRSKRVEEFKDIVNGKSGGATVLLAGPPGCGKTLTAEIMAEAEGRALYSVHCSQLGTSADSLEESLQVCFRRAARWNAVLLLDEADVYVSERGEDLERNAIVGVFLRVLEYQTNTIFLTTNRAFSIDDAILSRCIARIDYEIPGECDRKRIWQIMGDANGCGFEEGVINRAVKRWPASGREIKNMVKLARVLSSDPTRISLKDIEWAVAFLPVANREVKGTGASDGYE